MAFTGICLLGVAIIVKAALIQIKEGPKLRELSYQMNTRTDTLRAERGNIYSEDGTLLSSTIPQFDVHVDLTVIKKDTFYHYVDTLSRGIASLIGKGTAAQWKKKLTNAYEDSSRYMELGKNLYYHQYQELRSFPVFNKGQRRGGLIVDTRNKRVNPYGMLASRTIGVSRMVWKGVGEKARQVKNVAGLEATCDSILSGLDGSCVKQRVVGGRWATVDGSVVEPQNGRDIVTTLDMGIQGIAENALMSVLQQYNCERGSCLVMEVQTGKVKAMASLGRDSVSGKYTENLNYTTVLAEPGSTFKLATLTSLLNDGYIHVDDMVDCEGGAHDFGKRVMHDSHHGLGVMTIRNAFAQSSNVAMGKLANEHYYKNPEKFVEHLEKLHLLDRTGIELAGEPKPVIIRPGSKHWNHTILPWMGTGYGVMITPLHVCMLYNAVANNGKMMKPYLIHSIREYGKDTKVFEPTVLEESIASESAIKELQSCTNEVVINGTGKHIQSPHYGIAGKTGTAQVADKGITYRMGVYQGTFVGYFPTDKPRYTICVVIRTRPHAGSYYGGTLSAPVFRMVSDKIFASGIGSWAGPLDSFKRMGGTIPAKATMARSYRTLLAAVGKKPDLQVPNNAIAQLQVDTQKNISVNQKQQVRGIMPDVTGMGLRDALYMLERQGLHVRIVGSGTVRDQSIAPGEQVAKGRTIVLQLS